MSSSLNNLYKILTERTHTEGFSNLCYQENSGIDGFNLVKCEELYEFQKKHLPNREIVIDSQYPEYCYIKPEPRNPPALKRCESVDVDPWMGYENCCPMEEYDMLMLLKKPEVQFIREYNYEILWVFILLLSLILFIGYRLLRKK